MSDNVQIKQFELSDQPALLSFLRLAYPNELRKSDPAYWKWHYLDNPYTSVGDIPLWVIKSGETIVGQLATIPVELKAGDESTKAIWILDFIVGESFRGKGLGKRLVLTAQEWCRTMLTLGINEQSTAVFRSLNWVSLQSIHRYQKVLFPGHAIKEFRQVMPLRRLTNLSFAPWRHQIARLSQPKPGTTLTPVAIFEETFDQLWQRASAQWPCAVRRSSEFLNWQFNQQPGKIFEVLGLFEQEVLTGYVVLFFRTAERGVPPKVAISDICYDARAADRVIDDLLAGALRAALQKQAGSVVIDVLDRRIEERLSRLGFWRIKKSPQFMASAADNRQGLLYKPANWYLTRGDSDVSIFEQSSLP